MATATTLPIPQVRWDLSALFDSIEDPRIEASWQTAQARAEKFEQTYRGKINSPSLTAETLFQAIKEIEGLYEQATKPVVYANLLFACDASSADVGAFLQRQMEKSTELNIKLMFFELELQKADDSIVAPVMADVRLEPYRHFVSVARIYRPHRLSEAEEVILEETANTGSRAFQRLFDELTANYVFKIITSEGTVNATEQEVLNMLRDPNREKRVAAGDALAEGLKSMERVLTLTYNNLIQDKRVEDRLRRYPYAEYSRHLSNELDKETVDMVMSLCRENYSLVGRYYGIKREILGLPKLTHVDRYAPLFDSEEEIAFDEAKQIVLTAFEEFSATLAAKAQEFFDNNWIDAEPRPGKTGGAFCSYLTPDTHPVVFMSYLNKMDNVGTLAHELGHGVHASLSREQSYLNFHGTLPLAELASTFGEMLVFEKLVAKASPKDTLALYADKIESTFATVFRQAAMFRFEQKVHEYRREKGELSGDMLGAIWQEEQQAMFDGSVELGEQHSSWWSYVSHFYSVPFYVYAYSFGELLSLSLFQMAKDQGADFEDKYVKLLKLGGSRTPFELMQTVGVDMKDPAFWHGGMRVIEGFVCEFERLWKEYRPSR